MTEQTTRDEEIERALAASERNFYKPVRGRLRVARNVDEPVLTAEDIRRRETEELHHREEIDRRRQEKLKLDRKVREQRWLTKIPEEWHSAKVAELPSELRHLCDEWLSTSDNDKPCLILTGPTGVGKTFTTYAIARELYLDRYEFLLRKAVQLMNDLTPRAVDPAATMRAAQTSRYLLLDDVGAEKRTEFVESVYNAIFDYRWEHKLPVVITTNVSHENFFDFFGERIFSRLLHNATVYKIEGEDRRLAP